MNGAPVVLDTSHPKTGTRRKPRRTAISCGSKPRAISDRGARCMPTSAKHNATSVTEITATAGLKCETYEPANRSRVGGKTAVRFDCAPPADWKLRNSGNETRIHAEPAAMDSKIGQSNRRVRRDLAISPAIKGASRSTA